PSQRVRQPVAGAPRRPSMHVRLREPPERCRGPTLSRSEVRRGNGKEVLSLERTEPSPAARGLRRVVLSATMRPWGISTLLLVIAIICFVLAAIGIDVSVSLVAVGLALFAASFRA